MWRLGCFLAGLPLGALAAQALSLEPLPLALGIGALAGGAGLVCLASLVARRDAGEPERGRHLARASSVAWLALPAGLASWVGLRPGAGVWLALTAAALGFALWRAARRVGPAGPPASALVAPAAVIAAASLGVLLATGSAAFLGTPRPQLGDRSQNFVWDMDARVVSAALPRCAPRLASWGELLARGSQPRLAPDGDTVWFEADGPDGRRQVHRLRRGSGEVTCWTCQEPGNNRRPALSPDGNGLVFDTDRYVSFREPANTEIHLASATAEVPVRHSRRLTRSPGPDDHGILAPGGFLLVWSRGEAGRFAVVSAAIQTGHGGLLLGAPRVLVAGRASWVAPVAWSADAHGLLVVRGQPLRPSLARLLDFGTGDDRSVGGGLLPTGSAGFSGDGGWLAVTAAHRADALGLLPGFFGFALGHVAVVAGLEGGFRGTELRTGASGGPLAAVDLGELADWGASTGVSLHPDGRGFVLGQRNAEGRERLVEARFACEDADVAS